MTKMLLVKHMGHDGPWLLIKTRAEYLGRRKYIRENKPEAERPLRLKLIGVVDTKLPAQLQKTYAAWLKADAARQKADAAWQKAYAAWQKTYAAWLKAYAAWQKTDAPWQKADAAWQKIINSPAGIKFHSQVCDCRWTPENYDILTANA